ncbi:MAG: hypothetical protein K5770_06655 [Lachnospiraceae bacterium]|nr:hypothetical protein [Lachnospiraceae bacterium]
MDHILSQKEIDALIEALNTFKNYDNEDLMQGDLLKNQVVLTQSEIDALIESLNNAQKGASISTISMPNVKPVLSQAEIDSLVKALQTFKEYSDMYDLSEEISFNQTVLSQEQIDRLIEKLLGNN